MLKNNLKKYKSRIQCEVILQTWKNFLASENIEFYLRQNIY